MADQGGSSQGSGGGGGEGGGKRIESLTPLTLKQLNRLEAEQNNFKLDDREVQKVTFVARVLEMDKQETSASFTLEDGTGSIKAKWWNEAMEENSSFEAGMYVRVIGQVRSFQGKPSLTIFMLRPIVDHNELTNHFLEAILTHLQVTKGLANPALASSVKMETGVDAPSFANPAAPGMGQAVQLEAESGSLSHQVLRIFGNKQVDELEQGLSIREATERLKAQNINATLEQVQEVVQSLSNDGHLYSTIDDDHFKATEETT